MVGGKGPSQTLHQRRIWDIARSWPTVHQVTVVGIHFIQEDFPDEFGEAISNWCVDSAMQPVLSAPRPSIGASLSGAKSVWNHFYACVLA